MDEPDRIPSERRAQEEADAAAAEAARIGGPGAGEDVDPAEQAPREGGEGEAEGFELAEDELVEGAAHGDAGRIPDPFTPERESDLSTADYGEPDQEGEPEPE